MLIGDGALCINRAVGPKLQSLSAKCKFARQIDCRAGVLLAPPNQETAQVDGTVGVGHISHVVASPEMLRSFASAEHAEPAAVVEHVSVQPDVRSSVLKISPGGRIYESTFDFD